MHIALFMAPAKRAAALGCRTGKAGTPYAQAFAPVAQSAGIASLGGTPAGKAPHSLGVAEGACCAWPCLPQARPSQESPAPSVPACFKLSRKAGSQVGSQVGSQAGSSAGASTLRQKARRCAVAGLALLASLPSRALAASASLGDMSDSLKAEFAKFGPMLKAGFALAGFFLVGLGLWQLYALSQQPGRPKSGAIMAIVVGACLLACATIAQMTSGSLAAGDPELSSIGL